MVNKNDASIPPVKTTATNTPSQSTIAIALAIVRSRPLHLSLKEYLRQLKQAVAFRSSTDQELDCTIDGARFWRRTANDLQKNIHDLQTKYDDLVAKSDPTVLRDAVRQSVLDEPAAVQRLESQSRGPSNLPLLRHKMILDKYILDLEISATILREAIIKAIQGMSAMISNIWEFLLLDRDYRNARAQLVQYSFTLCASVFALSLHGLEHLCRDIPGRQEGEQVITHFVRHLRTLLSILQKAAAKASTTRHIDDAKVGDSTSDLVWDMFPSALTRHILAVVANDGYLRYPRTTRVLPLMLAVILERTGKLIARRTFEHPFTHFEVMTTTHGLLKDNIELFKLRATQLEGSQLAWIIQQIMADDRFDKCLRACLTDENAVATRDTPDKDVLVVKARKSLQATLLRGVFGEDDGEFVDALPVPELFNTPNTGVEDVKDTLGNDFVASVWDSIGWDLVLGRSRTR